MSWCNSEKRTLKVGEFNEQIGGIDKPAAVYIAARDMRLEYHLSFIQSIRRPKRLKNIETDLQ